MYGYSAECPSYGLTFRAPPGFGIRLHIVAQGHSEMPAGDLVVTGYWTGETKDRLVGLQLDQELQRILDLIAIGGILMIISACIGFRARPPTKNESLTFGDLPLHRQTLPWAQHPDLLGLSSSDLSQSRAT